MKNTDEDDDFDFSWAENFSKRMTKFGEKMAKFGEKMADLGDNTVFNDIDEPVIQGNHVVGDIVFGNSVVTVNGKSIIKKNGKKIVIDKDGNVTIDGKKAVTLDESCHKKTAAECNANKITLKLPADAMVHKDLESDMEVISRGELKRVIYENNTKIEKIYWHIAFACVMSCSLGIFISCLICKCL